jgi:5-methylcytosine-specific restriction endonuclease McrA
MEKINEENFKKVCKESDSMAQAAIKLGLHFNTFKKYAIKFNCYITNQSGKGINKKGSPKVKLSDILEGNYPHFQTYKLKNRMLREGLVENVCSVCGINEWFDKPISMELDHIDGDRSNHKLENLRMLCPNCHSQTETYRSKNIKKKFVG